MKYLHTLKTVKEGRGTLNALSFDGMPFEPQRIFYVTDVPAGETRGGHAHKECKQYLICIKGKIKINVHGVLDSFYHEVLLSAGESFFIDNMWWSKQQYMTGDDILLVLCSLDYDKDDYLRN